MTTRRLRSLLAAATLLPAAVAGGAYATAPRAHAPRIPARTAALARLLAMTSKPPSADTACHVATGRTTCMPPGAMTPPVESSATEAGATGATTPDRPVEMSERADMETPSGYVATAPQHGTANVVVVHGAGAVSSVAPDGTLVWHVSANAVIEATGRPPHYLLPFSPIVPIGTDVVDPFDPYATPHPYAVADLTGDGVDDVAVLHEFISPASIAGDHKTMVSVLDGRTGEFVWTRLYPGWVADLAVVGTTLLVGETTGEYAGQWGEAGSRSVVEAWTFGGGTATRAWSYSTGVSWARWTTLQPLTGTLVAAAWTDTPLGTDAATRGHLLVLDAATGAVSWQVATAGYPRLLAYDATRDAVVATEEIDPGPAQTLPHYAVTGRAVATGATFATVDEDGALALSLAVADLAGDAKAEWAVGDLTVSDGTVPCPYAADCETDLEWRFRQGRVLALDPATGAPVWTQTRGQELATPQLIGLGVDVPQSYALLPVGRDLVVASYVASPANVELERLDGRTGTALWSRRDTNSVVTQLLSVDDRDGLVLGAASRPDVYGVNVQYATNNNDLRTYVPITGEVPYQVVRTYDPATGTEKSATPLLGRINAAAAIDVNGDGTKDVVAGGESGAVFAIDGTRIADHPGVLWRRTVAGPVHQIEAADLDGDGRTELVVAATRAVEVLDPVTGVVKWSVAYPDDLVWSVTVADVTGDKHPDVVVPTSTLAVYDGVTHAAVWSYQPPAAGGAVPHFGTSVVTPQRLVVTQYVYTPPTHGSPLNVRGGLSATVALTATGTEAWVDRYTGAGSHPTLWHAVSAAQGVPGVNGTALAVAWHDESNPSAPGDRVDLVDAATGTVVGTAISTDNRGAFGAFAATGRGAVGLDWWNSALASAPATTDPVLSGYFPFELQWGQFGALGRRLVQTQVAFVIQVLKTNALDPTPGATRISPAASFFRRVHVGRAVVSDLDGDGSDEIVGFPFDWDALALVDWFTGGGWVHLASDPAGLNVLAVAPQRAASTLTLTAPDSVQYSDAATVEATLTTAAGPVANAPVDLTVAGRTVHATTGADGVARAAVPVTVAPGDYTVSASFAGDEWTQPVAGDVAMRVVRDDSALSVARTGTGSRAALVATLADLDSAAGLGGRAVELFADGTSLGTYVTSESGVVTYDLPPRLRGGSHQFTATFAGDAYYVGAQARST